MGYRGEISRWLMHDDRKALFEVVVAGALNILFLALAALLLWSLGKPMLALRLAQGYGVLWGVTLASIVVLNRVHRLFRVGLYTHADSYVLSNLVVSCLLQVGWAAFAAVAAHGFVAGAPVWMVVTLYLVGGLSCLIAFFAVSSFYQGHIYRMTSLPLALLAFSAFSLWPGLGSMWYGWLFDLF